MPDPESKLPQPTSHDHAYTIVKAVISAIPVVGGSAAELFSMVIAPALVERRDRWLQGLADGLHDLETRVDGFRVESLSKNEAFISSVLYATTAAIKSHQKEKLNALRNAVLNSALTQGPDADLQLIFLGWVDSFTPMHLFLLGLLSDPASWDFTLLPGQLEGTMGSISNVIYLGYPKLRGEWVLLAKVTQDLTNEGLIGGAGPNMVKGYMVMAPAVTDLGKQFLTFVSEPKP